MKRSLLALALITSGCTPKPGSPGVAAVAVADPVALLARARAEPVSTPRDASFSVSLHTPTDDVSAQGSLVVSPPDRFRVELRGPIGPPAMVVTCDGHQLLAWATTKNQAWRADDADSALRRLTGEAAGIAAVADLLLGRLPAIGEPTWETDHYRWTGPAGEVVEARLDPATAHLLAVHATDAAGAILLDARYTPSVLPKTLDLDLPAIGARASVVFKEWQEVAPPDSAFTLTLPDTVAVTPLFPG